MTPRDADAAPSPTLPQAAPPRRAGTPPPSWLLVAMVGAGPFTLQIVVPLLPGFAAQFATSTGTAQLLLTMALFGIAVGQLFYGPLSDRFGRRPLVLIAFGVFLLASAGAALAQTIGLLVWLRTAQAIGSCGGMVIGRAMIRDCFPREKAASVLGYVMMGMTVAPMVAPYAGSLLQDLFGWQAVFVACALLGAFLLVAIGRRLPETLAEPQPLPGIAGLAAMYGSLLRMGAFRGYVATVALSSGVFFTFLGGAPHVVVTGLGMQPRDYALAFLCTSGFYAFGNFLAGRYSQRVGVFRMIEIGTVISFLGVAAVLAAMLWLPPSIFGLFVPSVLMAIGNGISQTNAMVAALSVRPQVAGTASGLTGFAQMGMGALLSWAAGVLEGGSGVATALIMMAAAGATQLVLAVMRLRRIS
ncbi:MAG: multidrug effflux MFS transporter [Acetobacteraceae bacterium]|nr:multidrug effflux MFS transporter [Acetobacteraceae bacterium]